MGPSDPLSEAPPSGSEPAIGVCTTSEAARLLGVSNTTVQVMVERGELRAWKTRGGHRRIDRASIDALRAARAAGEGPRWHVRVRSGTDGTALDAIEWSVKAEAMGAGEVLLTSWDRDGTREGYDLALTAKVASSVRVPVIASGGAASCEHVLEAIEAGADAVLAAGIFHDGRVGIGEVKQFLSSRGIEVRP